MTQNNKNNPNNQNNQNRNKKNGQKQRTEEKEQKDKKVPMRCQIQHLKKNQLSGIQVHSGRNSREN
jgi:hypothetical protein